MLRVGIVTQKGNLLSFNANTREEIDDYLLKVDADEGLKMYRIINKETKELIEKWQKEPFGR